MNTLWLTTYVLVWPVIVAGVLLFIARAFFKECKEARKKGRALI